MKPTSRKQPAAAGKAVNQIGLEACVCKPSGVRASTFMLVDHDHPGFMPAGVVMPFAVE